MKHTIGKSPLKTVIENLSLKSVHEDSFNIMRETNKALYNNLNNQLEEAVIEGLKLKGFKFNNKFDLEEFVKTNCRVEDNIVFKERVYFVNEIPFFLHKYEVEMCLNPITENRITSVSASLGSFAYL